jgi:hypothetical protein
LTERAWLDRTSAPAFLANENGIRAAAAAAIVPTLAGATFGATALADLGQNQASGARAGSTGSRGKSSGGLVPAFPLRTDHGRARTADLR